MLDGLSVSRDTLAELLRVDIDDWRKAVTGAAKFFEKVGDRLSQAIHEEKKALKERLSSSAVAAGSPGGQALSALMSCDNEPIHTDTELSFDPAIPACVSILEHPYPPYPIRNLITLPTVDSTTSHHP